MYIMDGVILCGECITCYDDEVWLLI